MTIFGPGDHMKPVGDSGLTEVAKSVSDVTVEAALELTATERLTQQLVERLERELEGAWRAGFDYLYAITHNGIAKWEDTDFECHSVRRTYIPSNNPNREPDDPMDTMNRYDLRNLTTEELREAKYE